MDRKIGEWPYYNFAAESFHTRKLCSIGLLYSIEVDFYWKKTKQSLFEPHFGGLKGNVRSPSIASLESPWSTLYSS